MSDTLDDNSTLPLTPEPTVDDVEMSMGLLHQEIHLEKQEDVIEEQETYDMTQSFDDDEPEEIEYETVDEIVESYGEEEEEEDDETSVLKNGLDPLATSLISSSNITSERKEEEDELADDVKMNNVDFLEATIVDEIEEEDEGVIIPKISREVKNLQISTNESSDIISNFLFDTPRRSKKVVEITPDDEDDDEKSEIESSKSPSLERLAVTSTSDNRRESIKSNRGRSRSVSKSRSPIKLKYKKAEISTQSTDDYASDNDEMLNNEEYETESEAFSEQSISRISIDDRKINSPPKPGWDSFCFKCHNDQAVLSLPCSTCKCSYHRNCVRPNPIPRNVDEFVCPECRDLEIAEKSPTNKYGHERIEVEKLSKMLGLILKKMMEGQVAAEFKNEIVVKMKDPKTPMIITNMSFSIMESRIKENYYTTTELFIHDMRQLEHNWNVIDRTKAKLLKPALKTAISEINELESCVYCYEDSFIYANWFVRVCKRPHLLVWAKLKGVSKSP